jgi:hypothetical protein
VQLIKCIYIYIYIYIYNYTISHATNGLSDQDAQMMIISNIKSLDKYVILKVL